MEDMSYMMKGERLVYRVSGVYTSIGIYTLTFTLLYTNIIAGVIYPTFNPLLPLTPQI